MGPTTYPMPARLATPYIYIYIKYMYMYVYPEYIYTYVKPIVGRPPPTGVPSSPGGRSGRWPGGGRTCLPNVAS